MKKIMFVCHGNICRSPMAEFIFKDLVREKGLSNQFYVASSATSSEEIYNGAGNSVYPPAERALSEIGISCKGKRAVQLKSSDYEKYDMFVVMDSINLKNIRKIFPRDPFNKISLLLDHTESGGNIDDPWYSGDFKTACSDIMRGCKALLEELI